MFVKVIVTTGNYVLFISISISIHIYIFNFIFLYEDLLKKIYMYIKKIKIKMKMKNKRLFVFGAKRGGDWQQFFHTYVTMYVSVLYVHTYIKP